MKSLIFDNLSFKLVALGVAVILWVSMMGHKDSTMVKDFELQVLVGPNLEVETSLPQLVKVELVGPRVALKKINQMSPVFTVDLTSARAGRQVVPLSRDGLSLPIGAHVVSIEPREIVVVLHDVRSRTSDAH